MRRLLIFSLFLSGFVQAQQTPQLERFWLNSNTHSSVKSLQFYQIDSLITKDSSHAQLRILPDEIFAFNSFSNIFCVEL